MGEQVELTDSFKEWKRLHRIVEAANPEGEPTMEFVHGAAGARPQVVAALPAAFNPLTAAHLELLEAVERKRRISEFLLVLDKKTIDKELYGATLEDRLLMLELFSRGKKKMSVVFSSHGLFIDKVRALRKIYPKKTELLFIVGYDTLVRLFDPHYYERRDEALKSLFAESRFLVGNRGGSGEASVRELLSAPGNKRFKGYVEFIEISDWAARLSSTEVREKVERGEEIRRLVPFEIEGFIRQTGLYAGAGKIGAGAAGNRHDARCDILRRLLTAGLPDEAEFHLGGMVAEVMEGEDVLVVVEKFLMGLR